MDLKRLSLHFALAAVFSFAVTGPANAVLVEIVTDPPFNVDTIVPGHTSYTFRINLEAGDTAVTAFDASFTSATMHHELTGATIWQDLNGSIPGPRTAADDSQFEFPSSEWLVLEDNEDDSPGLLEAVAARAAGEPALTADFNLAHIVIPTSAIGFYDITLLVDGVNEPFSGNFGAVPEASQVIAGGTLTLGVLGMYLVRRRWKRAVPASC
jgi:hypothetical protein